MITFAQPWSLYRRALLECGLWRKLHRDRRIHANTQTRTHANTHTRTHAHTHTRTHARKSACCAAANIMRLRRRLTLPLENALCQDVLRRAALERFRRSMRPRILVFAVATMPKKRRSLHLNQFQSQTSTMYRPCMAMRLSICSASEALRPARLQSTASRIARRTSAGILVLELPATMIWTRCERSVPLKQVS